ncbi:MAG: hypothetical protein GXO87_06105 [Chlorobi bacterium]|nr:hypothetical protein [Chlorobiota bacterium]
MSEMLANQYFISGRYFEALEEYSKLPREKQNDLLIKKKMIICSALNGSFERALFLLKDMPTDDNSLYYGLQLMKDECFCEKLLEKLEGQKKQIIKNDEAKKMQTAILSYFTEREKSLEYFYGLKNSGYSDIVNTFLSSIKHKSHTTS